MSGDWIKFDVTTLEKNEVWDMADALNRTPEAVIGHLMRWWVWADQQSQDGNAVVTQLSRVDQVANCTGFGDALLSTGWLVHEKGGYSIPKWDRHNGKSAKKRALAKDRQAGFRNATRNATSNAKSNAPPLLEKRREVPINNTTSRGKSPVDNRPVQGGITTATPVTPQPLQHHGTGNGLKPPAAMTPEEREAAGIADPPPGLMQTYAKTKHPAFEDGETEPPTPASNPAPKPHRASNGTLPENWADTPESIDHAADILGMKRLPFEEDDALSQRITARLALG